MHVMFEQPFTPARQTTTNSCGTVTVVDDSDPDPDPDPGNGDDGDDGGDGGDNGDTDPTPTPTPDPIPDLSDLPGGAAGLVVLVVVLGLLFISIQ